jgi:hypothetical protein
MDLGEIAPDPFKLPDSGTFFLNRITKYGGDIFVIPYDANGILSPGSRKILDLRPGSEIFIPNEKSSNFGVKGVVSSKKNGHFVLTLQEKLFSVNRYSLCHSSLLTYKNIGKLVGGLSLAWFSTSTTRGEHCHLVVTT